MGIQFSAPLFPVCENSYIMDSLSLYPVFFSCFFRIQAHQHAVVKLPAFIAQQAVCHNTYRAQMDGVARPAVHSYSQVYVLIQPAPFI